MNFPRICILYLKGHITVDLCYSENWNTICIYNNLAFHPWGKLSAFGKSIIRKHDISFITLWNYFTIIGKHNVTFHRSLFVSWFHLSHYLSKYPNPLIRQRISIFPPPVAKSPSSNIKLFHICLFCGKCLWREDTIY